jgi:poly(A) polymerase
MEIKEKAISIIKKLVREGYVAYFAGGCVRDELMGHPSYDIDIATDAPPSKILDLFSHTIPVGLSFGVIIVVIEGHAFEVSTFRRDINYFDGRKPESIELSTAEEDAIRRDFTINGLFYDPLEDMIYDYVCGREDIKKGVIRTIGSPGERFFEDRLRMIRAVRFSARFGFYIDPETEEGIRENADFLFPAVAMERVSQELSKMSTSSRFCQAMIDLHRLGLMQVIFPELKGVHLNTIKHQAECFKWFPKNTPFIIYLMEFFPEINSNDLMDLCLYLKLSSKESKLAAFHLRYKDVVLTPETMQKKDLVYFYANPASQMTIEVLAAHMHKTEAEQFVQMHEKIRASLLPLIERVQFKKPIITGASLANLGILEGRKMGALLKEAELLSIEHGLMTENAVIEMLKKSDVWKQKD